MKINTFDLDGVISVGIYPGPNDVIITGRSTEESKDTLLYLNSKGIKNRVFFNPLPFDQKTRKSSGEHKARIMKQLMKQGYEIGFHFEDDDIQMDVIRMHIPDMKVIHVKHDFTEKENVRHDANGNVIR